MFGDRPERQTPTPTPPASLRSAVDPPHKGEGTSGTLRAYAATGSLAGGLVTAIAAVRFFAE